MAFIEHIPPPKRTPVQISTTTIPGIVIYTVLCSDATIWTSHDLGLNWVLLAPIPQPKKLDITIGDGSLL